MNQRKHLRYLLAATVPAWALLCATAGAQAPPALETTTLSFQDFEQTAEGKLPPNVKDDSGWAGAKVPMQVADSGDRRYGKVVRCNVSGFAQIILGRLAFEKGRVYRVSLDIGSKGGQSCRILLRHAPKPYTVYAARTVVTDEQMRPVSFLCKALKTYGRILLMLRMNGSTVLSIDNIRIEQVTGELPAGDPPVKGNLLLNAGFELAGDGWFARRGCEFVETSHAWEGRRALKLRPRGVASSTWFRLSRRGDYLVRARVRSLSLRSEVRMRLSDYVFPRGSTLGRSQNYTIRRVDGWRTIQFRWRPTAPHGLILGSAEMFFELRCVGPSDGEVLIDAVEVRAVGEGNLPTDRVFKAHAPQELAVFTDMPFGVATVGQAVRVTVLATGDDGQNMLEVRDERDKLVRSVPVTLQHGTGSTTLRGLPCGYWRLTTRPGGRSRPLAPRVEGETFLAVAPNMPKLPTAQWMAGCHLDSGINARKAAWKLGLRCDRFHNTCKATKWRKVQPRRGEWVFDDATVESHRAEGQWLLGSLASTPAWVPQRPQVDKAGKPIPPKPSRINNYMTDASLPFWREYARRCAEHWRGRIDGWEVTNEPNFNIPPPQYMKLLQAAYEGVRAGDPRAVVVGLGGLGPIRSRWADEVIALGAGKYCDVISVHGYGNTTWNAVGGPGRLMAALDWLRENLAAAGTPNVPIWDTECGTSVKSNFTKFRIPTGLAEPADAARMFAKSVACAKAAGLAKVFYHLGSPPTHAGDGGTRFLWDINSTARMNAQALAVAVSMIEGRRFVFWNRKLLDDRGMVELVFAGRGARVRMFWKLDGSAALNVPGGVQRIVNMWGRTITPDNGAIRLGHDPVYWVIPVPGTHMAGQATQGQFGRQTAGRDGV